jgi:hypothetical protein
MYQCQACKSIPEAFLIRRQESKISLSGRTPMEIVKVKNFLPKKQRKFCANAIVAYNSGQVLAGNFLLRTFIEQYIRDECKDPESRDVDDLFRKYGETLPEDFKQHFPSLQKVYDQLSNDIHGAVGSEAIFIKARADIEEHFDARRIFKLTSN